MRVLLLHAHPDPASFSASLFRTAHHELAAAGHQVDAVDLYAEGFDPVLSRAEWQGYTQVPANRASVEHNAARVDWAEAIVLVFPVWNFGPPAILKGYLDRVFLPGVSFHLTEGRIAPGLHHIRSLVAITTYGSTWWWAMLMGDPPRRLVRRVLRALIHPRAQCSYLAHNAITRSTDATRAAFVRRAQAKLRRL
jgi:NAD(P)H dehydrogenase (quinone)